MCLDQKCGPQNKLPVKTGWLTAPATPHPKNGMQISTGNRQELSIGKKATRHAAGDDLRPYLMFLAPHGLMTNLPPGRTEGAARGWPSTATAPSAGLRLPSGSAAGGRKYVTPPLAGGKRLGLPSAWRRWLGCGWRHGGWVSAFRRAGRFGAAWGNGAGSGREVGGAFMATALCFGGCSGRGAGLGAWRPSPHPCERAGVALQG